VTSSWFFLSTLNYDARSTTHQINFQYSTVVRNTLNIAVATYKFHGTQYAEEADDLLIPNISDWSLCYLHFLLWVAFRWISNVCLGTVSIIFWVVLFFCIKTHIVARVSGVGRGWGGCLKHTIALGQVTIGQPPTPRAGPGMWSLAVGNSGASALF